MTTQAVATFGVYGKPSDDELDVLELADEYRSRMCEIYQSLHEQTIDYRNTAYPDLFVAMVRYEQCKARLWQIERIIKEYHSDIRDRNEVTEEQKQALVIARKNLTDARAAVSRERKLWLEFLKGYRKFFTEVGDWKNVKSLAKRKALYVGIDWPEEMREYAEMVLRHDLALRELSLEYQEKGLHSAIRAEIVAASKPKLTKTSPGMRYRYGRKSDPRPWEKILLQFGGGLPFSKALQGTPQFGLKPIYTNHKVDGEQTVYQVWQQIGTQDIPRRIEYRCKLDKPIPEDAVIQRWSLVVRGKSRKVIPICTNMDFSKKTGKGILTYDLKWSVVPGGVLICRFHGDHVQEDLVLPDWLVEQRMALKWVQEDCDKTANEHLERQHGVSPSKKPGALHGVEAMVNYLDDLATSNLHAHLESRLARARRQQAKAVRCIEKIYETVCHRVCKLHSHFVPDPIDLAKLKRYSTRDLLKKAQWDKPKEIMFAVAPGKLQALIKGYGLASSEVEEGWQGAARTTDVFSGWILSLGRKTGTKPAGKCHRSQHAVESGVG